MNSLNTILPLEIQDDMIDFFLNKINGFKEYNIIESVSEWGERKRSIGSGLTARPGKVDYNVTPPMREIADNLSDNSPIIETYVIKATQIGFTVMVMEMHMGYAIYYGIGPLLYISGDAAMAEEQFEKRVDEMIESAGLQGKIRPNVQKKKGKATGDRTDSKSYNGTFMRAVGPNSESKLRSFPMRILHEDEIDVYPQRIVRNGNDTGDTLKKAERRADSYGNLKKIIGGSTPKNESTSRIAKKVEEGCKRYYNIRCPECDFQHPLVWSNFKWDKTDKGKPDVQWETINGVDSLKNDPTYFECPECKFRMTDKIKDELLLEVGHGGTACWIPSKKAERPFVRSYVYPGWLGFRSWLEICLEWEAIKDDPFLLPDFVNDVMAEPWRESINKPDDHDLLQLAQQNEQWDRGTINTDILFLTIGVDIQQDRIEAALMGWARNRQMYVVQYFNFDGDPSFVEDKCWKELSEVINNKYVREDGVEIYIQIAFIDSQYLSDSVDAFCDQFPHDPNNIAGVYPVQSRETQDKLVKNAKSNIKTPVVTIADQSFKKVLYNTLRKRPQSPGNFPSYYLHCSYQYSEEFYKQLTSEEIVPVTVKGVKKGILIQNTKQKRNEVLDTVKYNLAAFQYALDNFFHIYNQNLKSQKRGEIQQDIDLFMDVMEDKLLNG